MKMRLFSAAFFVLFFSSSVFAQEENGFPPEAAAVLPSTQAPAAKEGHVSIDFREADIRNVLQILALKSGVNIVASPEVTGLISIQLNDVPWKQALEVILDTYGYAYEQRGNIILVTTIDKMKQRREDAQILSDQEPLTTETFPVNFGKASEIVASLEKIKSERGYVNFDERTNMLIITDTSRKLEMMAQVIKKLDTTTPQVFIEAKIIETTIGDEDKLGIDWTIKASATGASRPIIWPFDNESDNRFAPGTFPTPESTDFTFGTLNVNTAQVVLELLDSKNDTNILSNPHIVTMDNKTAEINVGTQYPIPTYTYNEEQAALQVSGWEYMDIGILFKVTPHINDAGYITMEIEPRITEIDGTVTVENTSLPKLSNQSASTSVMIKDGDTLVIGGLIKDKNVDIKRKVPFLGDIPIVGLFFTKKENTINKTDLLIFITPHIITPVIASGT